MPENAAPQAELSREEKSELLEIARKTIEARLHQKERPRFEISSSRLKEKKGAFVTLKKRGTLRGCIGYIEAYKPLWQTVQEMAEAAAFDDPRFPPMSAQELADLGIEISVLSPMQEIEDVSQIEVGKHGLYIKRGSYHGLLLPQVATEYGWDRTAFLEQTCQKAGLPKDAWKDSETKILIFSAEVFGEKDVPSDG